MPCFALLSNLRKGKTNQKENLEYGAAMRHCHPRRCPVGEMACGSSGSTETEHQHQLRQIDRALSALGLRVSKKPHLFRQSEARAADLVGISLDEIRKLGRLNNQSLAAACLSSLPRQTMRAVAEF